MEHTGLFLLTLYLRCSCVSAGGYQYDMDYLVPPRCHACDVKSCPLLTFCAGVVVKDQCGCCQRCSSYPHLSPYKPPPPEMPTASPPTTTALSLEDVCERRNCPSFNVCVVNQQGLPICTCPSEFICNLKRIRRNNSKKGKPSEICGINGVTYPSICHLKIAYCNSKRRIKRKHYGACTGDDVTDFKRWKNKEESKPVKNITYTLDTNYMDVKLNKEDRKRMRKGKRKERKQRRKGKQRKHMDNKLIEKINAGLEATG